MLETPFGVVRFVFDGVESDEMWRVAVLKEAFRGADGAWRIELPWENDGAAHQLFCFLDGDFDDSFPESGEDYEAVTFCRGKERLTIGCEADFSSISRFDFGGSCCANGIRLDIGPDMSDRTFRFGAAYVAECTAENESLSWLAADPTLTE